MFPSYRQVTNLAGSLDGYGLVVWLMRGCGLRIREALGVRREDFRDRGRVLRVARQSSVDGTHAVPLKHRKPGQYRDVPVPAYLWNMVKHAPSGPLCKPANDKPYLTYDKAYRAFVSARDKLGIPSGFTPHSLRHAFATALLSNGVPLTDVSTWLGHLSTEVTSRVYAHVIPSAMGRAASVLDSEYAAWSAPEKVPTTA